MRYVLFLVFNNIVKKIKRTLLSISATAVSAAVLFSSMTLLFSITSFDGTVSENRYHYAFYSSNVTLLNDTRYDVLMDGNTNYYGKIHGYKFNLRSLNDYEHTAIPFEVTQGAYPKSANEILVSEELGYALNEKVSLDICFMEEGNLVNQLYHLPEGEFMDSLSQEYVVVGLYTQTNEMKLLHSTMELIYTADLKTTSYVNYVVDNKFYLTDSLESLLSNAFLERENIVVNYETLSKEKLNYYFTDISSITILFCIIVLLALTVSYQAINNVIIATDQERKKELGLMKSIGANPQQVCLMIILEMLILGFIGAVVGIFLGYILSLVIFSEINSSLNISVGWGVLLNPMIIMVSLIISGSIVVLAGTKAYYHNFQSMPISDLKEGQFYSDVPVSEKKKIFNDFQWRMFLIYNGRMKKQSHNINRAFIFLLLCTSLFTSIFFSLKLYENKYESKDYDFEITSQLINPAVMETLYNHSYSVDDNMTRTTFYTAVPERIIKDLGIFRCLETIGDGRLVSTLQDFDYDIIDGKKYYDFGHSTLLLDDFQLQNLSGNYVVEGDLENMSSNDVVIIHAGDSELTKAIRQSVHVGAQVYLGKEAFNIKAIVAVDKLDSEYYYIDTSEYKTFCAVSLDAWQKERAIEYESEKIRVKLTSSFDNHAHKVEKILAEALEQVGVQGTYVISSPVFIKNENQIMVFFFKTLLYPMVSLLFILSMFNLNQVIQSNIYLKRRDISILKSVGMKPKQLYQLFFLEYLEGYLNASAIVSIVIIPLAILVSSLGFAEVFDFGENILGAQIISVGVVGVLLAVPIVLISFINLSRIKTTESLKNQF